MKRYKGIRRGGKATVTVDNAPLDPYVNLRNFNADGFEWGYEGSGPSQLGFAILVEHMGGEAAFRHYRRFVRDVIAELDEKRWELNTHQIANHLREEIVEVPMDLETFFKKVRGEIE